ncbi:MAG: hypothetical protein M1358_23060, partial [Chloroflexi bacterium]|nr:hypothetical protein [Chloroflexota bacterium]
SDGEFAGAIQRLLVNSQLRQQLGQTARRVAETAFGWPYLIDQMECFYEKLLGSGPVKRS